MKKNIILLSDGTGNAASKIWRTNVWRFFQALDLSNSMQVACYDDGVGTSAFKPLALVGSAFGWGLKRNVLDLYEFLCRNYEDGCQIYALGFSRGAFTVRVLIGLVVDQGLVKAESEADRHKLAKTAYRAYRRKRYHTWHGLESVFRDLRDLFVGFRCYDPEKNIKVPAIRFLGVWDTVAAYGLPIEEMTRGISRWIWPLDLPDRTLNEKVKRACHALSLDDERTTFHPLLWTEVGERPPRRGGRSNIKYERISQVWFAGVHANVGGGYPDDSLANVSLYWMMKQAQLRGVRFKKTPDADPDALRQAISSRDKDGRLYDSRHGLAGYYRYGPRKLEALCDMRFSSAKDDAVKIEVPKIHASVIERRENGAHAYAPIGLPAKYAVVTDDGDLLEGAACAELPDHAERRAEGQEQVWDLVWWRRVVYFATLAASAHLALFPLIYRTERSAEVSTPFRTVSDTVRLVGGFSPNFLEWWLNSFAANPGRFLVGGFTLAVFIWLGTWLGARITDKMRFIWEAKAIDIPPLPRGGVYALRTSRAYQGFLKSLKGRIIPTLSVLVILYCAITLGSHFLFNVWDAAGFHCKPGDRTAWKKGAATPKKEFSPSDKCWASGVTLEYGRRYEVTITPKTRTWKDNSPFGHVIDTDLGGFEISELESFGNRVWMTAGIPLRRVFSQPWFRVIGRIGTFGSDEYYLDVVTEPPPEDTDDDVPYKPPIVDVIRPRQDGELFLYVNEGVIGLPWLAGFFYEGNEGRASVTIRDCAELERLAEQGGSSAADVCAPQAERIADDAHR